MLVFIVLWYFLAVNQKQSFTKFKLKSFKISFFFYQFLNFLLLFFIHKSERQRFVEVLPEASPTKQRELSQEECQKLIEMEEITLRELRLYLRGVTWKLLADRKFKEFSKPVDPEEVRLKM